VAKKTDKNFRKNSFFIDRFAVISRHQSEIDRQHPSKNDFTNP